MYARRDMDVGENGENHCGQGDDYPRRVGGWSITGEKRDVEM
jgi:hypothetical protein